MNKRKVTKPQKKTTEELMDAVNTAMASGEYYFTDHGDKRSKSRKKVNDLEIVKILKVIISGMRPTKISMKEIRRTGTIIFEVKTATETI